MKKQGPCRHCGTNSTPLWRNEPAEKPVLCNACGSRYRIRGTLANYAPKHAQIQQPIPPPKRFKINRPSSKKPKYKSIANLYTSIPYSTCPDNIDCRARVKATSLDSMMSLPRTSCSDDEVEEHDQGNSDLQIGGSGHVSLAKMVRRQEPSTDVGAVSEARVSTKGGFTSVKIPQRLLNQRIQQCSNSLIGELLLEKGDPPYELHELKQRLNKVWAIQGSWQLISLGRGCFHIFLTSAAAKERLLETGMLSLQPGTFSVHPWQPDFNPHEQKLTNALVWVRFFGLPLEYWDASILACISKGIGQFVRVDKATLEAEFGHYARVLIDVDLSSSIPLTIGVEKQGKQLWIDLEYENLPKVCKFCTSVGHSRTECRQNNLKDAPKHENHTRVIQKKGKVHYVKKSVARQTEATNGQVSTQQNLQVENEGGTVDVCHSFNPNGSPHRAGVAQATVPVAQVVKRLREDLQITREELNPPSSKSCSLGDAQGLKLIVDLSVYNLQGFKDK